MKRVERGSVWIVDLGMAAKRRPCLIISVALNADDRKIVTLIPHTSSLYQNRFEVCVEADFLNEDGVFNVQGIATVGQDKLIRKIGDIQGTHLAQVEDALRLWLDL